MVDYNDVLMLFKYEHYIYTYIYIFWSQIVLIGTIYRETYLAVHVLLLLLLLIHKNRVNNHSKIMDMNCPYLSAFPREIKTSRAAGTKKF
jgi:hypothetical protein